MQQVQPTDSQQLTALKAVLAAAVPRTRADALKALDEVVAYLYSHRQDYHWVGIYQLRGDTLEVGPYRGPVTDHVRIKVGQGVCGTAVLENKNQLIGDVRAVPNYLACNLETRSEIVVLVREAGSGKILGQIDVDGTKLNQFTTAEEGFLSAVAELIAPLLLLP